MPSLGYRATAVPNFQLPRRSSRERTHPIPASVRQLMEDSNTLGANSNRMTAIVAIVWVTLLSAVCRIAALQQPMRYDESVTWAFFVGRPWATIVSQYQFPNNHVFYSLLAKATPSLAAWQPWALRLPAAVAGIAIVPLTWAVGRRFADRHTALLGAALAGASTPLILYSTNARGYSLVVMLFLCLLLHADRLREAPRPRGYIVFAALSALGLYTIPVMLYPIAVIGVWLAFDAWPRPDRVRRLLLLGTSCIASAGVAAILYLPIIRTAGVAALGGNKFVTPSSWMALARDMPRFLAEVATTWAQPAPPIAALLIALLAVNGMRRSAPPRTGARTPSLAWSAIIGCVVILVLTRRAPFVRVWLFLLPLYLLAVARGTIRIGRRVGSTSMALRLEGTPWPALTLATALTAVSLWTRGAERSDDTGAFPGGARCCQPACSTNARGRSSARTHPIQRSSTVLPRRTWAGHGVAHVAIGTSRTGLPRARRLARANDSVGVEQSHDR